MFDSPIVDFFTSATPSVDRATTTITNIPHQHTQFGWSTYLSIHPVCWNGLGACPHVGDSLDRLSEFTRSGPFRHPSGRRTTSHTEYTHSQIGTRHTTLHKSLRTLLTSKWTALSLLPMIRECREWSTRPLNLRSWDLSLLRHTVRTDKKVKFINTRATRTRDIAYER